MKISARPTPPMKSRSLTVVAAARNEADNLAPLLGSLERTFATLGFTLPVLLIDDGSTDRSQWIFAVLEKQYGFLRVIRHSQSLGLTECLQTALSHTQTDWLYLMPADLESDPQTDLPLLLAACGAGVDGVAGWRQGREDGKVLASKVANLVCRLGFGSKIHDLNWIKLVRRDLLAALPLDKVTYAYILPLLAGTGCQIREVPTLWHPRRAGRSKFGVKRLLVSGRNFCRLWWWFYVESRFLDQ